MEPDHVTLMPVNSDENVRTLREFRKVLETTRGPQGSLKLLVTGGGYHQLTASGAALLSRLELENPILQCISQVARGLVDHGLYLGMMVSHLLELHWSSDCCVGKQKMSKTISMLSQSLQELMQSDLVCRKVNFSSINSFLPLVRSVVTSKPNVLFGGLDVDKVCFQIVRVFLNCIDEQTGSVGRVHVKVDDGGIRVTSYNGLLYQITEDQDLKVIKQIISEVKILIFTLKLENSCDSESFISEIDQAMSIIEEAIEMGVNLVACQKTVAPEIKLYLMRKGVLLLDRMGTDFTSMLVQISQAFPISHLQIEISDVPKFVGTLSSVKHIQFNASEYVLLQNKDAAVGTLLLQTRSLAGTDHVKELVHQAINSLRSLATHPVLTFGGGCLEVWLSMQIGLIKHNHPTDRDLQRVAQWVQLALLSTCTAEAADSVYHHGWRERQEEQGGRENSCCCGHVTRSQLIEVDSQLIPLSEVTQAQLRLSPPRPTSCLLAPHVLVDNHQQKVNVIFSALETFTNLNEVGLILYLDKLRVK
uniref:Uncharacterized protein n=1 Tax=Graphocephala atropunctata TaxID=36148 RepID=A0A1B6KU53_9HEMI